jgi:hypothetical protein
VISSDLAALYDKDWATLTMAKPLNISAVYQLDSDFTAAPTPAPVSLSSSGGKTTILVVVLVVVFVVIVIVIGCVLVFIFLRKERDYERSEMLDGRPIAGTAMAPRSSCVERSTMYAFDDVGSSSRAHSMHQSQSDIVSALVPAPSTEYSSPGILSSEASYSAAQIVSNVSVVATPVVSTTSTQYASPDILGRQYVIRSSTDSGRKRQSE